MPPARGQQTSSVKYWIGNILSFVGRLAQVACWVWPMGYSLPTLPYVWCSQAQDPRTLLSVAWDGYKAAWHEVTDAGCRIVTAHPQHWLSRSVGVGHILCQGTGPTFPAPKCVTRLSLEVP